MDDDEDDEPANSENPEGLPPVSDSTENFTNNIGIPETTSEKKPQLQEADSRNKWWPLKVLHALIPYSLKAN